MGRKKKAVVEIKVGVKLSKKVLTDYHNNPDYKWWDSDNNKWTTKKLSDRLPKSVTIEEIRNKDSAKVIIAKSDDTKVLWIEVENKKHKMVSRPMVVPLTLSRVGAKV